MKSYFEEIKKLKDRERLNIFLLVSPPRCSSSLIEGTITRSPNVLLGSHEPFAYFGAYDESPEEAYKRLFDDINEGKNLHSNSNVVVKEMSHWIGKGGEFQKALELFKPPIAFLIRNPLLSTESKLRKILTSFYLQETPSLTVALGEYVGVKFSMPVSLDEQQKVLDIFAEMNGKQSYEELLKHQFKDQDYSIFEPLLERYEYFDPKDSGFAALNEEIVYLKQKEIPYVIIDSTDFRLNSEGSLKKLFRAWGIPLENEDFERMLRWDEGKSLVQTHQEKPHQKIWYDTLSESKNVLPPLEKAVHISHFPRLMQDYLRSTDLPIYIDLYRDSARIKQNDLEGNKSVGHMEIIRTNDPLYYQLSMEGLSMNKEREQSSRITKATLIDSVE